MRISKDKDSSLSVLQIITALFIMIAPVVLGSADIPVYAYLLFIVSGVLFLLRTFKTGKFYMTQSHFPLMVLAGYAVLSAFRVSNRSMHFVFVSVIFSVMFVISLITDYFTESPDEKAQRRMMYMVSTGSILCGILNCIYWITEIVPFGKEESFSQGMGSNNHLAVFMLVGIASAFLLVKGNSKLRKILFVLGIILMIFVFVMCKSVYAWILLVCLGIMYFAEKKSKKLFFPVAAALMFVFTVLMSLIFFLSDSSSLFKDVCSYGSVFGKGGGFLSAGEIFFTKTYPQKEIPGLFSVLFAASGIFGLLCSAFFTVKPVLHFIKLRTWVSALNVFLTVMITLLPLGKSLTVLVLWAGIIAYNEKAQNGMVKRTVSRKPEFVKKTSYIAWGVGVIAALFVFQRFIVLGADLQYKKENYTAAYSLYNTATVMNVFDSESALGAAQSLYKSGAAKNNYSEAIALAEKAQKRDRNNLLCNKLKAEIYNDCGRYDLAIQEYSYTVSRAKLNYEYNLLLAESFYKIAETSPEGSSQTIDAYDKIVRIAKETDNLDYREKINNIADKALVYTRRRTEIEE